MYFDSGIDNYGGWLNVMKDTNLLNQVVLVYIRIPQKRI